jgi:hypothetical protein
MSIKIYDGLRIKNPTDPFRDALLMREVLESEFYSEFKKLLVKGKETRNNVTEVWEEINELHNASLRSFDSKSIGYDAVLLPHHLVLIFTEHTVYRDMLINSGIVEEYGFWDNTDMPEDVSDADWVLRRHHWESALGGDFSMTPSEAGLSFTFPSRYATIVKMCLS